MRESIEVRYSSSRENANVPGALPWYNTTMSAYPGRVWIVRIIDMIGVIPEPAASSR